MYYQLCTQSICNICSACNRSVSKDCLVSNVSSDVSIVSNVSIVGDISIVRSVSSVSNSAASSVCNNNKKKSLKKKVIKCPHPRETFR